MSRLIHRPITVTLRDNQPHTFLDGEDLHTIAEIVDSWVESGNWIVSEPTRNVYRLITTEYAMFDIEESGGKWSIYRVWD